MSSGSQILNILGQRLSTSICIQFLIKNLAHDLGQSPPRTVYEASMSGCIWVYNFYIILVGVCCGSKHLVELHWVSIDRSLLLQAAPQTTSGLTNLRLVDQA